MLVRGKNPFRVTPNQYSIRRTMNHFIRGFLTPFDGFGNLFQVPPPAPKQNRTDTQSLSGFERDAANLQQDWNNVGTHINNAINTYERESSGDKRQ